MSETIWLSFSNWLTSLSITPSSSIHVEANGGYSLFLMAESHFIPFHSIVYIGHIFFIHASVDGHQGSFHSLAIVDIAAMNIGVQVSWHFTNLYLWGKYPVVQLLGHRVALFLASWGTPTLFSRVAVPVCIPTNRVRGFLFLCILANICHFLTC